MKRKKKYKILIITFSCVLVIILLTLFVPNLLSTKKTTKPIKKEIKEEQLNEYVKTNKTINLYIKEATEYKKIGEVTENTILHIKNDINDYYKVEDLDEDYYIESKNLSNYEEEIKIDNRYKNYIVFNKNIKTTNTTSFYDENNNLIYTINKDMNLPIIVSEDDKVGVIYNNKIMYIKLDDSSIIVDNNNTSNENTKGIGVLNYHFFYDESKEEEKKDCNQIICLPISKLKEQLDYIKNNNYFTPTMNELEMYIDGKIQLPKSVVITIDDGWRAQEGLNIINDYKLNATIFVITGSYDANSFKKEYIEVHSHSEKLHEAGVCSTGQGGGIQCLDEEIILNDLKTSSSKLNGSTVFCYPFYEYNNYAISMLKKAGYTMAFAGEESDSYNMTTTKTNKYKIPRFVILSSTTMNDFTRYLKGKYYS